MSTAVYESPQEARLVRAFLFLGIREYPPTALRAPRMPACRRPTGQQSYATALPRCSADGMDGVPARCISATTWLGLSVNTLNCLANALTRHARLPVIEESGRLCHWR